MEGGAAQRGREKLATVDDFDLLQDSVALFDLYNPLPAPVSAPMGVIDMSAPPPDAMSVSMPHTMVPRYPSETMMAQPTVVPNPRTPELSLQETEELLHTLDATSFFQDQPQSVMMPPASVGLLPIQSLSSQTTAPVPRQVRSPAPNRRTVRAKPPKSTVTVTPPTTNATISPPTMSTALTTKTRSGKSAPTTATGKMRNPSRERLQAELAYLRNKVVELQDELTSLHEKTSAAPPQVEIDAHGRALVPVWQRIAERQLEGRRRAEAENLRLKDTLEGQIMLARHLENVLRKRPNVGVLDSSSSDALVLGGDSPHKKRLRLGGEDAEFRSRAYEHLLAEVDEAYARTDVVFRQNGIESSVDDSVRHAYVKTRRGPDGCDVLYAELLDINIIPFELDRVGTAAWRSVKRQYYAKTPYDSYQRAPDDENTIALKYRMTCERKGQQVPLDAVLVMRRFVERDRVAIVWRCVSRAARDQSALSGMYTDETGWSVFKPVSPSAELSLAGAGTVMQSCVHVVPKRASGVVVSNEDGGLRGGSMRVSEMQHEIGLLTNAVIDAYEDVVVSMNATMEDILLEETLATPDPVALRVWSW